MSDHEWGSDNDIQSKSVVCCDFFTRITTVLLAVLINFTDVAMEAETDNNSKFLNK